MKYFMAADLHLGASIRQAVPCFKYDSIEALLEFEESIIKDPATDKAVILAGDIFNKEKISGPEIAAFKHFIMTLRSNNILVYAIEGNHDEDSDMPIYEALEAVPLTVPGEITQIGNRTFVGFKATSNRDELLEAINRVVVPVDFLILHEPFQHLLKFEGAWRLKLEDIPANYKTVFCGDIHIHDIRKFGKNQTFISPGSMHPCKLDENGFHGWVEIDSDNLLPIPVENKRTRKIEPIQIFGECNPIVLKGKIETRIAEICKQSMSKPVFDIQYEMSNQNAVEEVISRIDDAVFIAKPTKSVDSTEEIELDILNVESIKEVVPFAVNQDDIKLTEIVYKILDNIPVKKIVEDLKKELRIA